LTHCFQGAALGWGPCVLAPKFLVKVPVQKIGFRVLHGCLPGEINARIAVPIFCQMVRGFGGEGGWGTHWLCLKQAQCEPDSVGLLTTEQESLQRLQKRYRSLLSCDLKSPGVLWPQVEQFLIRGSVIVFSRGSETSCIRNSHLLPFGLFPGTRNLGLCLCLYRHQS